MQYSHHRIARGALALALVIPLMLPGVNAIAGQWFLPHTPYAWQPAMAPSATPHNRTREYPSQPTQRRTQAPGPHTLHQIEIVPGEYAPVSIEVERGESITWYNNDQRPHTVTADYELFDSGYLEPGEPYTRQFNDQGTYRYYCRLDRRLRGVVRVR